MRRPKTPREPHTQSESNKARNTNRGLRSMEAKERRTIERSMKRWASKKKTKGRADNRGEPPGLVARLRTQA